MTPNPAPKRASGGKRAGDKRRQLRAELEAAQTADVGDDGRPQIVLKKLRGAVGLLDETIRSLRERRELIRLDASLAPSTKHSLDLQVSRELVKAAEADRAIRERDKTIREQADTIRALTAALEGMGETDAVPVTSRRPRKGEGAPR